MSTVPSSANSISDSGLRYRIITAPSPRVAPQYPFECQPESLDWSVFPESLKRILGTGWSEPAASGLDGRDADLIELDQQDKRGRDDALQHNFFSIPLISDVISSEEAISGEL